MELAPARDGMASGGRRHMGQTVRFQQTLRRLAMIYEGFVEDQAGLGLGPAATSARQRDQEEGRRDDTPGPCGWRMRRSEDGGPVVFHADDRPAVPGGPFQRLFGAAGVAELA